MNRYYSPMRPISIGTYPKPAGNAVIDIHNFDSKQRVAECPCTVWGWIEYAKPLSAKDMEDYELI